jgi:hypothetical protein
VPLVRALAARDPVGIVHRALSWTGVTRWRAFATRHPP